MKIQAHLLKFFIAQNILFTQNFLQKLFVFVFFYQNIICTLFNTNKQFFILFVI